MAIPDNENQINRYVGVVIAEIAATLVLYIILKIVHFCVWGHLYVCRNANI